MDFEWYPWKGYLYRRDTSHLTLAEHGAYRALIDAYMLDIGGPIPDNDRALAGLARCSLEEWLAVAPAVRPFFRPSSGRLAHKRCEIELDRVTGLTKRRSESGKKGAEERWKNNKKVDGKPNGSANGHAMATPMAKNGTETETEREDSVADATGAKTPNDPGSVLDLKKELWKRGRAYLATKGLDEKLAGKMIGQWLKTVGQPNPEMTMIGILADAEVHCQGDVIEYVQKAVSRCRSKPNGTGSHPQAEQPIRNGFIALAVRAQRRTPQDA